MNKTVISRMLNSNEADGFRFFEALRWSSPFGQQVRLWLQRDEAAPDFDTLLPSSAKLAATVDIGQDLIVDLELETANEIVLETQSSTVVLRPSAPEPELFDGLNVIVGQRHHEPPKQVAEWVFHHVDNHGAQAVLLVDRQPPKNGFTAELRKRLQGLKGLSRVVVVTGPLPLGLLEKPAISHAANARKAKDRSFKPDPWQSEVATQVLYDILRVRFLSRAQSVLALDPCDWVRSNETKPVFEQIQKSQAGFVRMKGEQIFPWRVRPKQYPEIGDHVCRSDTPERAPTRWGVDVGRAGSNSHWTLQGVHGAQALDGEDLIYDRAMSLVMPHAEISALVNKDLLVLDDDLLVRAEAAGHEPVLPPERKAAPIAFRSDSKSVRTAIVTCMKNEGPFILEWVAYHRMIGVDDILIYTNDCSDGTERLLDVLMQKGLVVRRDNPFRTLGVKKPQMAALTAARDEAVVQDASWLISMDADEFVNIHAGSGRLQDLYDAIPSADMISLTWRLFGNDDIAAFVDAPITSQFTRCAPHFIRSPHQAWGFKTLFRNNGSWESLGVHRPRGYLGGVKNWVNGSGATMPERVIKTGWRSQVDSYGYDLVTLNHYACRSVESFLVKRDRGRVNHVARDQGEAYWFRMNNNDQQDHSIQRLTAPLIATVEELKRDPEIAAAHNFCVKSHQAKIQELMSRQDYAELYQKTNKRQDASP